MKNDKKEKQDKIRGMSRMQRSKDLETSWRSGKTPASGYDENDDPAFGAGAMAGDAGDMGADMGGDGQQLPADDPSIVYMGPEDGPFECSNCTFFQGDGQPCQKVSDPVSAEGCCNQFQSAHNESVDQEHTEGMQGMQGSPAPQPDFQGAM